MSGYKLVVQFNRGSSIVYQWTAQDCAFTHAVGFLKTLPSVSAAALYAVEDGQETLLLDEELFSPA